MALKKWGTLVPKDAAVSLGRDDSALDRALRLLLMLTVMREIDVVDLVCDLVPEYFDTPSDSPDRTTAWYSFNHRVRESIRDKVTGDIGRLQAMGFAVSKLNTGTPGSDDYSERLTMTEQPFVPISLDADDVPFALRLVTVATSASDDLPIEARIFAQGISNALIIDMTRPGYPPIQVVPWKVIRGARSRWYGLCQTVDTDRTLTFALGGVDSRYTPMLTSSPAPAVSLRVADVNRMLNPLTWGHETFHAQVSIEISSVDRFIQALGLAVTSVYVDGSRATLELDVSSLQQLAHTLAPLALGIKKITPEAARNALEEYFNHIVSEPDWLPTDVREMDARLRKSEATITNNPETDEEQTKIPAAAVAPIKASSTVTGRIGAVLLMLRALEQVDSMTIRDLAKISGLSEKAAARAMELYVAAESDLANRNSTFATQHRPIIIHRDRKGEVTEIQYDPDSETLEGDLASLGRREIGVAQLASAMSHAWDLLHQDPDHIDRERLQRFVTSASSALGIPLDGFAVATHSPPKPGLNAQALEEAINNDAIITFTYKNPWTLAMGERTVVPVASFGTGGQMLVDSLELAKDGSPLQARTFAMSGMSDVEITGKPSEEVLSRAQAINTSRSATTITLAVHPESQQVHTLVSRWQARTFTHDKGAVIAEVDFNEPVVEQLLELLFTCGSDVRVLFPQQYRDLAKDRAALILNTLV